MRLSSKTRYGMRLMIVLAGHYGKGLLSLKDIAGQEDISEKYLSRIVIPLKKKGLIKSEKGVYGGYQLARHPMRISLREIVEPLEDGFAPAECLRNPSICDKIPFCISRDAWVDLEKKIKDSLNKVTLHALLKNKRQKS